MVVYVGASLGWPQPVYSRISFMTALAIAAPHGPLKGAVGDPQGDPDRPAPIPAQY